MWYCTHVVDLLEKREISPNRSMVCGGVNVSPSKSWLKSPLFPTPLPVRVEEDLCHNTSPNRLQRPNHPWIRIFPPTLATLKK